MPITSSAKKALRQSLKRRDKNTAQIRDFKSVVKKFRKSPTAEALKTVYQKLDKAAKANLIKKNTSSRLKSRLSIYLSNTKNS